MVLLLNQILSDGDEVIKNILLILQLARLMPFLAVFASSAQVSDNEDTAMIQPYTSHWTQKVRAHADVVSAICLKQHGSAALQLRALLANDVQRHVRAILRHRKLAHGFGIIETNWRATHHSSRNDFPTLAIESVPCRRIQPCRGGQQNVVSFQRNHLTDC